MPEPLAIKTITVARILELLANIKRFDSSTDPFYDGWRAALDTVEIDIKNEARGNL